VLFGPILNFITCFGEEWGWRGYLLPKMADKMPRIPMLLITGTIWGIWHAPIIAMGHNYGTDYWGFPIVGILMMCVFCIALGTIFSYLCIKTQSCIPAIIAHGAINSFAGAGLFFATTNNHTLLGPTPAGIIGGCGLIVAAIIILVYWDKDEKIFHFFRLKLFQLKLFGKHETSKQIKY
ncbi:MAG: CPBP family intramembrane metalloprotease, partial [Bacteroidales bacterium]|nr:CPBP family intramembrane metalloprotease [Bacteroidales bacterium]